MKKDKTEIICIIDRSGSMNMIKQATEKGFADFIENQKKIPGECFVSLYEFDHRFNTVYEYKNINDVGEYTLVPSGWTALLDAIGFSVSRVGDRLAKTEESERPENVIVVILTDGAENRSKEFSKNQIKNIVEHQENKYNWKFMFIGSNQDAVLTGQEYGFKSKLSLSYDATSTGTHNAFMAVNCATTSLRGIAKDYSFSNEDRENSLKSK